MYNHVHLWSVHNLHPEPRPSVILDNHGSSPRLPRTPTPLTALYPYTNYQIIRLSPMQPSSSTQYYSKSLQFLPMHYTSGAGDGPGTGGFVPRRAPNVDELPQGLFSPAVGDCCVRQGTLEACRLFSPSIRLVGSQAFPRHMSCRNSSYLRLLARTCWEYASNLRQYVVRSKQSEGHRQHARIIRFASRHQPM